MSLERCFDDVKRAVNRGWVTSIQLVDRMPFIYRSARIDYKKTFHVVENLTRIVGVPVAAVRAAYIDVSKFYNKLKEKYNKKE